MADMHSNSPKTLRQDLLAQRQQFSASLAYSSSKSAVLAGLENFLLEHRNRVHSIALYCPIQNEIDLRPTLLRWAKEESTRILSLPFARQDKHLDFYTWEQEDLLIPSMHGVPEPDPNNPRRPKITPDCILIPCVGWSKSREMGKNYFWRLGYGGGYFDRTLAQLRKTNPQLICIGVGYDWQELNDSQWLAQAHDEPLDAMLTESGLMR